MRNPNLLLLVELGIAAACGSPAVEALPVAPEGASVTGRSEDAPPPVLAAYDRVHEALAADKLDDASTAAGELAKSAEDAAAQDPALSPLVDAARRMRSASDLAVARVAFGDASRTVIAWLAAHPQLARGRHVFSCPMAPGYGKWVEPDAELTNPYMGAAMPTCGSPSDLHE